MGSEGRRAEARSRSGWLQLAVVLTALAAAFAPIPPHPVERFYSNSVYLVVQNQLTAASNYLPFAIFDGLIAVVLVGWTAAMIGCLAGSGGWLRRIGRIVVRTIVLASALYILFLLLWGLNYRRVPLERKLQFDKAAVSMPALRALGGMAADRVNALYRPAHALLDVESGRSPTASPIIQSPLAAAFDRVQRELGASRPARAGRPKRTWLDVYFRRAGVDGMTDPYFLEVLVTADLLPVERPFVVAHEWSHLAGYTDEGEANFVGWLTCLGGDERDQYSGWLSLYEHLLREAGARDQALLMARLRSGPHADRRAIGDRIRRRLSPRVSAVGWAVYDRYLKANRIEAGAASYEGIVRLALGTRFGPDWTPLRQSP
jgi:hypothetical protein